MTPYKRDEWPKAEYIEVWDAEQNVVEIEGVSKGTDHNGNEVLRIHLSEQWRRFDRP